MVTTVGVVFLNWTAPRRVVVVEQLGRSLLSIQRGRVSNSMEGLGQRSIRGVHLVTEWSCDDAGYASDAVRSKTCSVGEPTLRRRPQTFPLRSAGLEMSECGRGSYIKYSRVKCSPSLKYFEDR